MLDQPPFAQRKMPGATGQQVQEDVDAVGEEQASPEEQAQYDKLMRRAYAIMADEKAFPQLQSMLQQDPHNAIADATVTIIEKLEQEAGEQDTDLLQALAEEIIPNLAELAVEMGTDIPEPELEQIAAVAIAKWAKAHPERIDQEGMQAIGGAALGVLEGGAPAAPAAGGLANG